jgi:hypothetical protein
MNPPHLIEVKKDRRLQNRAHIVRHLICLNFPLPTHFPIHNALSKSIKYKDKNIADIHLFPLDEVMIMVLGQSLTPLSPRFLI